MSDLIIEPMQLKDINEVWEIEKICFPTPWPPQSFANEISGNKFAYYIVSKISQKIVGYAGMWVILEEAHLTNLAVRPDFRRRKIGESLLLSLIKEAIKRGSRWMSLEVRESNIAARKLYEKFGFKVMGIRKSYYRDNLENALIMWSEDFKKGDKFYGLRDYY